jgi:AcrR family transcriptional regulator
LAEISSTLEDVTRRRPGGRTADVTKRINEAVLTLLVEGGIDACTFQNVAARAGIERSTLYRRNSDRWPTIIEAIIDLAERETAVFNTGSFTEDLSRTLFRLNNVLKSPLGPPLMAVASALKAGVAPGESERFWASRRKHLAPMFEAAIARGEVPIDVDREELFAMAAGPIYFRNFISALPVDESWIRELADKICSHYCLTPTQG